MLAIFTRGFNPTKDQSFHVWITIWVWRHQNTKVFWVLTESQTKYMLMSSSSSNERIGVCVKSRAIFACPCGTSSEQAWWKEVNNVDSHLLFEWSTLLKDVLNIIHRDVGRVVLSMSFADSQHSFVCGQCHGRDLLNNIRLSDKLHSTSFVVTPRCISNILLSTLSPWGLWILFDISQANMATDWIEQEQLWILLIQKKEAILQLIACALISKVSTERITMRIKFKWQVLRLTWSQVWCEIVYLAACCFCPVYYYISKYLFSILHNHS